MDPTLNDSITIPEDVLFRDLDGEAVLLNLKTGTYFGLNPVGTRMWQLIGEQRSLARVLDVLASEYDADRDVLATDLLALAGELCAHGLGQITAT
jgi:coenzyme PQQ synthesis protein D (PqqD)